jgi:UDP-N-acetyl-D-mannosaminuronate dehydrogenase
MNSSEKAVTLVVGLGEVGNPLYTILQRRDASVAGIDIEPQSVNGAVGIMHVCFPFTDSESFADAVEGYATKYSPEVIVVNSTVAPGTSRSLQRRTGVSSVYRPIRGKHTKMVDDLYKYVKFVAGVDGSSTKRVQEHFAEAGLKSDSVSTPETLELAKLLETTYFGVLIAWAQEMNRFSDAVEGDYRELGKFFCEVDYLPRVLFQPGVIGGHCVMPNIALLQQQFKSFFLDAVQGSNEARKQEVAARDQQLEKRLDPITLA